jgi:hypothetical protein
MKGKKGLNQLKFLAESFQQVIDDNLPPETDLVFDVPGNGMP